MKNGRRLRIAFTTRFRFSGKDRIFFEIIHLVFRFVWLRQRGKNRSTVFKNFTNKQAYTNIAHRFWWLFFVGFFWQIHVFPDFRNFVRKSGKMMQSFGFAKKIVAGAIITGFSAPLRSRPPTGCSGRQSFPSVPASTAVSADHGKKRKSRQRLKPEHIRPSPHPDHFRWVTKLEFSISGSLVMMGISRCLAVAAMSRSWSSGMSVISAAVFKISRLSGSNW